MAYTDNQATRPPPPPAVSDTTIATIVYVLYLAGFFTGFSALAGVIVAYVQYDAAEPLLRSHYQFQIRTFWIGLLYFVIGVVLCFVLIGFLVLLWWLVWTLIRCIKGILVLNEGRPIASPTSWMFG